MIRHGRTDWNASRRIQGRTDIPLSATGRAEQTLRSVPEDFADAPAFSSPLVRATETARLMGIADPIIDDRLIEMNFGDWEGGTHAELKAEKPQEMIRLEAMGLDMRPPNGETPREVAARLTDFLGHRIADRCLLFCHKGVIRAAFSAALDWDMTGPLPFHVDWNAGQLFRFANGRLALERENVPLT